MLNTHFYLQFQKLDLEPSYEGRCYDYVSVASTEMMLERSEKYCGRYQGADYSNLSFISDGNFMVVKFVSDDKIAGQGFQAVHYSYPVSGECSLLIMLLLQATKELSFGIGGSTS